MIICCSNYNENNWNVFENDGSNKFDTEVTIANDALTVYVAFSNNMSRFENATIQRNVIGQIYSSNITDYDDISRYVFGTPSIKSYDTMFGVLPTQKIA